VKQVRANVNDENACTPEEYGARRERIPREGKTSWSIDGERWDVEQTNYFGRAPDSNTTRPDFRIRK